MRILIIKMSSLGDLFHALPAVHLLKTGLKADVDWVVHDRYVDLVKCFSDVDRVIPFFRHAFFSHCRRFLKDLRARDYDLIIDMQGLLKSAIVGKLARGGKRIGPSFYREGSRLFYGSVAGPRNKDRHAVEENLDMVTHLGLATLPPEFPMTLPPVPDVFAQDMKKPGRHIAILPMSRWLTKNWPATCFAQVARQVKQNEAATFFLFGGPENVETCATIEKEIGGDVVNCAGKLSLVEMASMLKGMDLLIANDSGPVHMSAALGTPALVVFGPTDAKRTGPYGDRHRIASVEMDCRPCLSRTCHRPGIPCLAAVTPEYVTELARDMLRSPA